jgi:FMN-dependent NADH-azoreductase
MARLLHIDTSGRTAGSISRRLSRFCVDAWLEAHPGDTVAYRDVAKQLPPQIDDAWVRAAFMPPDQRTDADRAALRVSDELVDEFLAADVHVLGIAMYNFNVPAPFKIYVDQVVRFGRTFLLGPYGPQGLAPGKRILVCGACYSDYGAGSPIAAMNHVDPWLRTVYGYMGITDVRSFWARDYPGDEAAQSLAAAQDAIRTAVRN